MVYCAAPCCNNRSFGSNKKAKHEVKGWQYIPQNKTLRAKWIAAMRREPPYPKDENFAICGLHFSDDCFIEDLQAKYCGTPNSFKLKDDAVPSLFEFSKPRKRRQSSEKRAAKRSRQDIVTSIERKDEPCSSKSKSKGAQPNEQIQQLDMEDDDDMETEPASELDTLLDLR